MAALNPGSKAPDVDLPLLKGGQFSLSQSLSQGSVLLAFFKVSCPICQYAFPLYESLSKKFAGKGISFVGISQDNARDTADFAREFGVTFPIALDDSRRYVVSNAYGLTTVPTVFAVGENGVIEHTSVGWSKRDMEEILARFRDGQSASSPVFGPEDEVADFRAG